MIKWSPKQERIRTMPYAHCLEVNEGSPRSGKSIISVARYANFLWQTPDTNHLILAFSQEQAYKLVMDCDGHGLQAIFPGLWKMKHDDYGDHMELITPPNNTVKHIYYKGGGKADSHKSFVGLSIGSVYFCEMNLLHMNAIQEAFRRTWAAKYRWHIADLNPPAPMDPIISEVFDVQDTYWQHWTPQDNPILTPARLAEIEATCRKSKYLYDRDWLGKRTIPKGVIYSMFDKDIHVLSEMPKDFVVYEMFFSGDGGLTDATSVSCNIIGSCRGHNRLYRVANWYYSGGDKAMSVQAKELVGTFAPYCREKYHLRESCWKIDPACKALRKEIELFGIQTDGADNNGHDIKGSTKGIKVGIEYAQSAIAEGRFFVVDDTKYGYYDFLKEIGMYCVDDHGTPVDAYNHAMDDFRYSINYFYKNYVI